MDKCCINRKETYTVQQKDLISNKIVSRRIAVSKCCMIGLRMIFVFLQRSESAYRNRSIDVIDILPI